MKKIFGAFVCLFLLNGCDDGDIVVETFDFGSSSIQKCSNSTDTQTILTRTNKNQLMLINVAASNFKNQETVAGTPITITTTGSEIIYRSYSDDVTSAAVCSTIPPVSPVVAEEYRVLPGGTIEIVTTMLPNVNASSLATSVSYNHQIKFKNVQFSNGASTISFQEYLFGTYTPTTNTLSFSFTDPTIKNCTDNKIFLQSSNQALLLDLPAASYPSEAGTQTITLDGTNRAIYRLYTGGAAADYTTDLICSGTPATPIVLSEEWIANEGTVTIVTTAIFGVDNTTIIGYKHNIKFTNIRYKKGSQSFLHPEYTFGDYRTN
ncbi:MULTISPECIES: hypothetical protein [unclassified Flavobacterium]|uniref:hypothetical protein n=1 Tax=unclassified Flavobacterium TaxID=196869 RepID=UPI00095FEA16|nr:MULTISPECIES: hypothetical protein [unclassified Flavobacterium]MBN9282998.1 hypothetical protein [Flavobacterium sp.]OJV67633.1 MAG: hypothetical protein BGO42_16505 [Flavobacterium sp. 40-81]